MISLIHNHSEKKARATVVIFISASLTTRNYAIGNKVLANTHKIELNVSI